MAYEAYLNGPQSALNGAINNSVTSIVVVDGSVFSGGDGFQWRAAFEDDTDEIVLVTGRSTNTLTVTRGAEGTTAVSHLTAVNLVSVLTKAAVESVVQVQDEGTIVGEVRKVNVVGAGVTATVSSGVGILTIPGAGPQNIDTLFQLDGGGAALDTTWQEILAFDYAEGCTITGIEVYADISGTITLDLQKFTYSTYGSPSSICGSSKPVLSSANKYLDSTLTGWTTALAVGDRLAVKVFSTGGTISKLWGFLKVQRGGNGINTAAGTFVIQNNGTPLAQRSKINFTTGVTPTDDPSNDRVNLAFTAPTATTYAVIVDEKSSGTNGGTFTAGAWRTRDLNTKRIDTGSIVSLASNQMTLGLGTYRSRAWAPGFYCGNHTIRLRDVTNGVTLGTGVNQTSETSSAAGTATPSILETRFTLSGTTVIELQHWCGTTRGTDGFGRPVTTGANECYATVTLEKE